MGYSINLRTLTEKSILGFGYDDVRDLSVRQLIDSGKTGVLITAYYGLSKINFTDEILKEIGITEELRIKKPGKVDREQLTEYKNKAFKSYYDALGEEQKINDSMKARAQRKKRRKKIISSVNNKAGKGYLMRRNHGH